FFFQAEDGIRDGHVTGVQTCALPISRRSSKPSLSSGTRAAFSARSVPQVAFGEVRAACRTTTPNAIARATTTSKRVSATSVRREDRKSVVREREENRAVEGTRKRKA